MCCSLLEKSEVGRLALLIPIPPLHYILHLHPHLELLSPTLSDLWILPKKEAGSSRSPGHGSCWDSICYNQVIE